MKRNLHVRFCRRAGEGNLPRLASVVRNEEEMNRIREYIVNNALRWVEDRYYPSQSEEAIK